MKFSKGFFDLENLEKFKLWHKKPVKPNTVEEPILLSSAFFKKSNQEEEMSERFFILKKSCLLYKKD
jgi:serine/threonine protein kinase